MNRREFCLTSAAAAISGAAAGLACLPAAGQTNPLTPVAGTSGVGLYRFIYDRRYSAGRAFGAAAEHAGSTAGVAAIGGDITSLWSRDLRHQWSAGGGATAGMNTAPTLLRLGELRQGAWVRGVVAARRGVWA